MEGEVLRCWVVVCEEVEDGEEVVGCQEAPCMTVGAGGTPITRDRTCQRVLETTTDVLETTLRLLPRLHFDCYQDKCPLQSTTTTFHSSLHLERRRSSPQQTQRYIPVHLCLDTHNNVQVQIKPQPNNLLVVFPTSLFFFRLLDVRILP